VGQARARTVAAFDFDGTVSRRDTLVPFVARVAGWPRSAVAASMAAWSAARGHFDWRDRDEVKAHLIDRLLTGRAVRDLHRSGALYAADVIDTGLRPEMVEQVRRHVLAGHETVFVSASLVYYLAPIATHLGMSGAIAVQPEERDGVLTGAMTGPNVRAAQKVVLLREWLGLGPDEPFEGIDVWAYGNTSGDHELLAAADHRFWLGKPGKAPAGAVPWSPGAAF
jgi:phosphatidylglycerophosphatase C